MRNPWLLLAIVGFAAIFKLYQLDQVPPSPSLDEVSLGYNAYSILKTGKDEYGTSFPILLRAYDDWRPALYVYFVAPFVQIFGLTTIAVRLPSVLFSILSIVLSLEIARMLFFKDKGSTGTSLVLGLLLALAPWHIYFSRLGHEVNLGSFFVLLGIYSFIVFAEKINRGSFLIVSLVSFAASLYSYQSQKVLVPLLLLSLFILFKSQILKQKRLFFLGLCASFLLLIPLVRSSLAEGALIRFRGTSSFSVYNYDFVKRIELYKKAKAEGSFLEQIRNHPLVAVLDIFISNYGSHAKLKWMYSGSKDEKHKIPFVGFYYIWESFFLLVGAYQFARNKKVPLAYKAFLFLWVLISPLPAAIANETPHAMRAFTMFLPIQILTSYGVWFLYSWFRIHRIGIIFIMVFAGLELQSVVIVSKNYFEIFPKIQSQSFQYAFNQAIPFIAEHAVSYKKIVISNERDAYQSYMFFLFHSKYDPALYQQEGGTKSGGFAQRHAFGRYEFRPIDWEKDSKLKDTLFIGNRTDFPFNANTQATFQYRDGTVGIVAVSP